MAKEPNNPFTGSSTAIISLIGILAIALMTIGGPFVIIWAKVYSPQLVISAGGLVFGLAFILASFSQNQWQFALTQGVLAGIGTCMSYVTMTAVAPTCKLAFLKIRKLMLKIKGLPSVAVLRWGLYFRGRELEAKSGLQC